MVVQEGLERHTDKELNDRLDVRKSALELSPVFIICKSVLYAKVFFQSLHKMLPDSIFKVQSFELSLI